MKTELIEKLKFERENLLKRGFFFDSSIVKVINESIQALEKQESEQVSAEEYKTQLVIPIEIRNKEYCDMNGKVIPIEFILGKEHFFYGGYGYIVLQTYASKQSDAVTKEQFIKIANWLDNLKPHNKVSVWSKNGEYKGLFTMDNEQLYDKYNAFLKENEGE